VRLGGEIRGFIAIAGARITANKMKGLRRIEWAILGLDA